MDIVTLLPPRTGHPFSMGMFFIFVAIAIVLLIGASWVLRRLWYDRRDREERGDKMGRRR